MAKLDPFGKYKREIWQQLADQLHGDFFRGKMFKSDRVEAFYNEWMVTLDTFTVDKMTFTRIRAPYVNRDDFLFKISRENTGDRIAKVFGKEDIEVGFPAFDKDFIIQGSDERKLQMMFANPKIRQILSYQPKVRLQLRKEAPLFTKPRFPEGVNELYYQSGTIIKDLDQLNDLFDLFAHTLDHLCAIGTAYVDDPGFEYYG